MTREEAIERLNIHKSTSVFEDGIAEAIDMAIEALSADEYVPHKACFDCMNRATRLCKGTLKEQEWCSIVQKCDNAITAEPKWIPVSERLPKENEHVGNVYKYYLIQDEYGDMHVAHLSGRGWETIESIKALGCDVLAWMPLPEPYREDGDYCSWGERREP